VKLGNFLATLFLILVYNNPWAKKDWGIRKTVVLIKI